MAVGATAEDVLSTRGEEPLKEAYLTPAGELLQLGKNPLATIDFVKAEAMNNAEFAENKRKGKGKKQYFLKKLFLQYAKKYSQKWDSVLSYPKQIKQKPAWFDMALGLFKDSEISPSDKTKIRLAFNKLWEYRDRIEPERVMSEEESMRQYGINSPYYQIPEASVGGLQPSEEVFPSDVLSVPTEVSGVEIASSVDKDIAMTESSPSMQPAPEVTLGVRKIKPRDDEDYISRYTSGFKSNVVDIMPFKPKQTEVVPQGEFNVGATPPIKKAGGPTGGGAFDIGRSMFSSFGAKGILGEAMKSSKPVLPSQPVSVVPKETITVTNQPQTPIVARKKKKSKTSVHRMKGIGNYRNIELPSIKNVIPLVKKMKSKKQKDQTGKFAIPKISSEPLVIKKSNVRESATFNKSTLGNMTGKVKSNVHGVVDNIKSLKKQVRGEFRNDKALKAINLKQIRANKVKGNRDLDILNQLKSETRNVMSRDVLECKMVPKLREQCDRTFKKNRITGEVSKFRNEFKDIAKMVPTVKGDRARITEVDMLGNNVATGIANAQVDDMRRMYKNSGSTKQMKIGMMEYDYSFVTGAKKKIKTPPIVDDEYYEEEIIDG